MKDKKLLLCVVLSFIALSVAAVVLTGGQAGVLLIAFALVAIFGVPAVGAFWMMYLAARHENRPLPMLLLATFVPFSFVWYYFVRVRPARIRNAHRFR